MALSGIATSIVYTLATGDVYLNVLMTFTFSIALTYLFITLLDASRLSQKLLFGMVISVYTVALFLFTKLIPVDYGFWGIILPAAAFLAPYEKEDGYLFNSSRFFMFSAMLCLLSSIYGGIQYFSLLALIPLAFYNGKRGFHLPKYFFYVFYPLHIAILYLIIEAITPQ